MVAERKIPNPHIDNFIDFLSLVSLDNAPTNSISAPVKFILQGIMSKLLNTFLKAFLYLILYNY